MKMASKLGSVLAILAVAAICSGTARAAGNGADAFEKMKALVGDWQTEPSAAGKATLHVELTSGGTALLERFRMEENGKPVEMTTLYFVDGDQLKLTHYCMAGNQPTMAGRYDPGSKTIKFDFVSVSNLKSANDGHMHHALYTFLDDDHLKMKWTFRKDQKDSFTEDVTYVRVR